MALLVLATLLFVFYAFSKAIYRIFFHPLRNYPGPQLAAITSCYEAYYDIVKYGGMLEHLEFLHKKYGPVVRITPNYLHFSDPRAYSDIYSSGSTFTKDPKLYNGFALKNGAVGLIDPRQAKIRRDMISPLFSRRAILGLEDVIQKKIDQLLSRLHSFPQQKPVDIHLALRCLTYDIITSYCFAQSFDMLDSSDFAHPIVISVMAQMPSVWLLKHLPFLLSLPDRLILWLNPDFQAFLMIRKTLCAQIDKLLSDEQLLDKAEHETIYHHLIRPNSGGKQLSREALLDEAVDLLSAGSDTVGNACTVGIFHVLNDQAIHDRLIEELQDVWPDKDSHVGLGTLEKLPYLTAVIKESLRVAVGVITPLPRVVGPQQANIAGHIVPPGTTVAIGHTFLHKNPDIFPEPERFIPERWLGQDGQKDSRLDSFLVSFSRGPRTCLGLNLAWAELYLIFGNMFRHFDMTIYDTSVKDLTSYREFFAPLHQGRHFHAIVKGKSL